MLNFDIQRKSLKVICFMAPPISFRICVHIGKTWECFIGANTVTELMLRNDRNLFHIHTNASAGDHEESRDTLWIQWLRLLLDTRFRVSVLQVEVSVLASGFFFTGSCLKRANAPYWLIDYQPTHTHCHKAWCVQLLGERRHTWELPAYLFKSLMIQKDRTCAYTYRLACECGPKYSSLRA